MEDKSEKAHAIKMINFLEDKTTTAKECPHIIINGQPEGICYICKKFIGLSRDKWCPCLQLGTKEAIKLTWLALEEKGYI